MANEDVHLPKFNTTPYFKKIPHSIYFYYIGPKDVYTYNKIRHYYYAGHKDQPLDHIDKVRQEVKLLIANAQVPNESIQVPPPIGENWKYVVWDRISWVVFAFYPHITAQPDILVNRSFGGTENHSFFDATHEVVDGYDVIFCVNHMKRNAAYDEIGNSGKEVQYFHFDLITNPALNWPGKSQYPDSGGTNMGPPVPPP